MNVLKFLADNGYQRRTSGPLDANMCVKEWDAQSSNKQTDTSILIRLDRNKISKIKFMTDKYASKTGSYYTCQIVFEEHKEVTPELLTKLEHCIARVSLSSLKELKEQFNAEPVYHKMHNFG